MKILLEILRQRRKMVILLLALFLADIFAYTYVNVWQKPAVDRLFRTWSEKRDLLSPGGSSDLAGTYRQGVADLASFNERIPPKKAFARVVGDLFQTASDNGIKIESIQYRPDRDRSGYGVTLNISGKYGGVKSFLADVMRIRELVLIDSVGISRSGGESVSFQVQLTVLLKPEGV